MTQPVVPTPITPPAPDPATPPPPTIPMQGRDGTIHQVPITEAKAAFNTGDLGFVGPIRGKTSSGKIGTVSPEDAPKFFEHPDTGVATDQEWHANELQKKYGGLGGMAETAGLGLLSGASLGVTDMAAKGLGVDVAGRYEANPGTALASKVGGSLAPAILSGGATEGATAAELGAEGVEAAQALAGTAAADVPAGASYFAQAGRAAAKVVSAPMGLTSRAGSAVENAVTTALGVGDEGSIITRLAKAAVAKGAGFGTEGAIYGMADRIDEDVLGDHELNAEKILASGLHGSLLGLAAGGVLGAGGELGQYTLGKIAPKLSDLAEHQAVKVIEPNGGAARKLIEDGVGRKLLDDGINLPGGTLEDIAPRITAAKQAASEKLGTLLDTADKAGLEGPSVREIRTSIEDKVLRPLQSSPKMNSGAIKRVQDLLSDIESQAGVPSEEALANAGGQAAGAVKRTPAEIADYLRANPEEAGEALKGALPKHIEFKDVPASSASPTDRNVILDSAKLSFKQAAALRDVLESAVQKGSTPEMEAASKVLSSSFDDAAERASKDLGGSFKSDYKAAKIDLDQLSTADEAAQKTLAAKQAAGSGGLSDHAVGLGTLLGVVAHGAGGLPGIALAAGSSLANHMIKTRGASTAAALLDKLSTLRGVERATQTVDEQISRGIEGMVGSTRRAAVTPRRSAGLGYDAAGYEARVKAIQGAAGNIERHTAGVAQAVSPIAAHAPNTARAIQSASARAVQYLASQIPKRQPPPSITPQFDQKFIASDYEMHDFNSKFDAVHDPASVLQDAAEGRVTKGQIDAIKYCLPKLYDQIVVMAKERLSDLKHPLSEAQEFQIGTTLGIPATPTLHGDFIRAMQQTYQGPADNPPGGGPNKPRRAAPSKAHVEAPSKQTALPIGSLSA